MSLCLVVSSGAASSNAAGEKSFASATSSASLAKNCSLVADAIGTAPVWGGSFWASIPAYRLIPFDARQPKRQLGGALDTHWQPTIPIPHKNCDAPYYNSVVL